ncbi:Replication protein [Slackia heliotrinireducens]|nr:Replication protein [Slackia heliotrinireducens]
MSMLNPDLKPTTFVPDENVQNILENIRDYGFENSVSSPYVSFVSSASKTALFDSYGDVKKNSYYQRKVVKKILERNHTHMGVCNCGKPIYRKDGGVRVQNIRLVDPEEHNCIICGKGTKFRGTQHCNSKWICPVCAAHYAYEQSQKARRVAKAVIEMDGTILFVTITIPHFYVDSLASEFEILAKVRKYLKSQRRWKNILRKLGYIGAVSAKDVTEGTKNGWHAHYHEILYLKNALTDDDIKELNDILFEFFDKGLERYGWYDTTPKHSRLDPQRITIERAGDANKVAAYVTKSVGGSIMGAVDEVVFSAGNTKKAAEKHYTPFQLAELAYEKNDKRAEERFIEYAKTTKGMHRIQFTPGLFEAVGVAETEEHVDVPVAYMNTSTYLDIIDKNPNALEHVMTHIMAGNYSKAAASINCVAYVRRKALSFTLADSSGEYPPIEYGELLDMDDPHKYENAGYDIDAFEDLIPDSWDDPDLRINKISDVGVVSFVRARRDEVPGTIYGNQKIIGRTNTRPYGVKLAHCYERYRADNGAYSTPLPASGIYVDADTVDGQTGIVDFEDTFNGQVRHSTCCFVDSSADDDPDCVPYNDIAAWQSDQDLRWEKKKLERRERMNNHKTQTQDKDVPIGTID